jgi:hypothetical protein
MNLALLVFSFDQYAWLWPGFYKAFRENWNLIHPQSYFASDVETENNVGEPFKMLYSGSGEWSDRLKRVLLQIHADYIFLMQEDHYPTKKPPNLSEMMQIVSERDLFRLQLSPVNRFYALEGSDLPLFFDPSSKYLVSHQPSIWLKDFLLSCLERGETPWQNEYKGTLRLNNKPEIRQKIAIYPCDWYAHKCYKGKWID